MWEIYDIVYYVCQFARQEDETNILSTTKYINDMIGIMRYRFSSKIYDMVLPVCGKIIPLIDKICCGNSFPITFGCLATVKHIDDHTTGMRLNFGVAKNLRSVRTNAVVPLPKSCQMAEFYRVDNPGARRIPPHITDMEICIVDMQLIDLSYMKDLRRLTIESCVRNDTAIVLPNGLEYFESMQRCIIGELPHSLRVLKITQFITPLPRGLVELEMPICSEMPDKYFPDTLRSITMSEIYSYKPRNLNTVVWPPYLENLRINASSRDTNTILYLPPSLVHLEAPIYLEHVLPRLRTVRVLSISSGEYGSLTDVTHDIAPDRWFIQMFSSSQIVKLDIAISEESMDMFQAIPPSLRSCRIRAADRYGRNVIPILPNIRKLSLTYIDFENNTIAIPDMVEKLVVEKSHLSSIIPSRHPRAGLRHVKIIETMITNIDNLPDTVTRLDVSSNMIETISRFPASLRKADVSYNPLIGDLVLPPGTELVVAVGINRIEIRHPKSCKAYRSYNSTARLVPQ